MDIFPRIPRSFLMELVKYSRMECNATPLDLSPIAEQLDDYIPCVSRIGTRHDFSQVILKVLFLAAILSSIRSFAISYSCYQCTKEFRECCSRFLRTVKHRF